MLSVFSYVYRPFVCPPWRGVFNQTYQEKRERTQINEISNERGEITTDIMEIQKIVRNYYEQLYAKELGKLGEMDKFLETYNLPKLNQEEAEA